ncbi:MAG: hypothetical protein M0C28_20750 [Candidatus Moduliflexus flocculans]|nr:hypothetical protein [Candidatus Moduliflexus flocculans]
MPDRCGETGDQLSRPLRAARRRDQLQFGRHRRASARPLFLGRCPNSSSSA